MSLSASSSAPGVPGTRGVLEWRLVSGGEHMVLVRGRPLWCQARAGMEAIGAATGRFDTVGAAVAGVAPLGLAVGALTALVAGNVIGVDSVGYLGLAAGVLTMVVVWFIVWASSEAVQLPPGSVLLTLAAMAGDPSTPLSMRTPGNRWASAAITLLPSLERADEFPGLPELVRSTVDADALARQLQLPEVLLGLRAVWEELRWSPDGLDVAASRIRQLVADLKKLARTQKQIEAKADEPILQARLIERQEHEEDVENKLIVAREAIEREMRVRRAILDEAADDA